MTRFAGWLARAVFAVAVATLLLGIALAALAAMVASWPYRRIYGPSRRRAQVEAALHVAQAAAVLAALLRSSDD